MPSSPLASLVRVEGLAVKPAIQDLVPADEIAAAVCLKPGRLLELADARIVPHFRVDGGPPLFYLPSLKRYIRQYLTTEYPGTPLSLNFHPVVVEAPRSDVPRALAMVQDQLCEYREVPPCVYFLIQDHQVVYVGQSVNLPARLAQHREKHWDRVLYLIALKESLSQVESGWIQALKPPLNRVRSCGRSKEVTPWA